ncbi:MAG: hypothetical protein R3E64_05200 [Halioglobus sp.]
MGAITGDFSNQSQLTRYLAGSSRAGFWTFSLLVAAVMAWAWWVRDYQYLRAESGIGYALGIVGASLMGILLLYPLRKRLRFMRNWFRLGNWFRLHMLLGVLGPLCILLHSNFRLGSPNSTVALTCMLLVAGSGLIGRYLYGKFHFGLYGQQVSLQNLKTDLDFFYREIEGSTQPAEQRRQLETLYTGCCDIIDSQRQRVSLRQLLRQRRWLRGMSRTALSAPKGRAAATGGADRALANHQRALIALLDKLAGLRLFERLFGLWHVMHVPVFVLMIITVIVHIVVVHRY